MSLVDTHCHLNMDPLAANVPAVLDRARAAGVDHVVVPAYDQESWLQLMELPPLPGLSLAFGLHPWVADQSLDLELIRDVLFQTQAVAIGEIGLDFKISQPGRTRQINVVTAQLRLALELDLPVILHCRSAFAELLQILGDTSPGLRGVVHAYSRGPDLAHRFTELGLHIAFGGALTRPMAKRARQSAAALPPEKLLLETDAPSIGLEGVAPKDTEPRHVRVIASALAEIRRLTLKEIAEVTTANARELFRI